MVTNIKVVVKVSEADIRSPQDSGDSEVRKAWRIVTWFLCGAGVTVLYVLVVHMLAENSVDRITYALPGYMFIVLFVILACFHYFTGVRGAKKQDHQ
jgi:cell division protein FtsW (lipid II flippase)